MTAKPRLVLSKDRGKARAFSIQHAMALCSRSSTLTDTRSAGPTVLGPRLPMTRYASSSRAMATRAFFVEGDEPARMHQASRRRSTPATSGSAEIQKDARATNGVTERPRWPAIVLRTPKGWTGPGVVDGEPVEGTFRSHQVPLTRCRTDPDSFAC